MVAFGHGFAAQNSHYISYYQHLASRGYVVIAPQFPDTQHDELGLDLLACVEWLRQRNSDTQSLLYGIVDTSKAGVSGHSMGGGASLLAASYDSRILTAAPMCPAETNPSCISRMTLIAGAVCIIAGSADGITPLANHQQPMYNAAQAFKSLAVLQGANHTRCMDTGMFDFVDPNGNMTRTVQQQLTRRYMTAVFDFFLKGDSCGWSYSYGVNANHPSVLLSQLTRAMQPSTFGLVAPLSGAVIPPVAVSWQRSDSPSPIDTVRYTVQTSSNNRFASIRYESTVTDTAMVLPVVAFDTLTYWRVVAWTSPNTRRTSTNVGQLSSPVPVELASFSARRLPNGVDLEWITESESNNAGFEVLRASDGEHFQSIAFVAGMGDSRQLHRYNYFDAFEHDAWYRLRQIDFDGTLTVGPTLHVVSQRRDDFTVRVQPNEVSVLGAVLNIGIGCSGAIGGNGAMDVRLRLWTLAGAMVAEWERQVYGDGGHTVMLRLPALPVGLYLLSAHSAAGSGVEHVLLR